MRNILYFLLSWCFLVGTLTGYSQNPQFEGNTVGLIVLDSGQVVGTGFICSHKNLITTCAHIFERTGNRDLFTYKTTSGEYDAKVVYKSFDKDIAILKIDTVIVDTPLTLSERFKFKLNDTLALTGFDRTATLLQNQYIINMSPVNISGYREVKKGNDTRKLLEFYGIAQPGYSGGPLFALDGKVIALLYGGMSNVKNTIGKGENMNFAIILEDLYIIFDFLSFQGIIDK